jgi:hypothetical protein
LDAEDNEGSGYQKLQDAEKGEEDATHTFLAAGGTELTPMNSSTEGPIFGTQSCAMTEELKPDREERGVKKKYRRRTLI